MSNDIRQYYNAEYLAITRLAAEFAAANTDVAEQLRLSQDRSDDPHVQRLLEGVAFLGARIQQRLDDEFPELTDALLGVLYPHYLTSFPSCMIAQMMPSDSLQGAATIERSTMVETQAVNGVACRFTTTSAVTLWPIRIAVAKLSGLPLPPLPPAAMAPKNHLAEGAAGVLRLTLQCSASSQTFGQLGVDRLRFFLRGAGSLELYELLSGHVLSVILTDGPDDAAPVIHDGSVVKAAGFGADEALLPWPPHGFSGFRLLSEYFALPDKFLFIDIEGIDSKTRSGAGNKLDITILLDRIPADLDRTIDANSLALGCTPLINLFPQHCEPIELDWTRTELTVHPDLRHPASTEIWSITRVRETRSDGSSLPWRPFFRMVNGDGEGRERAGSFLPIRRAAGGMAGTSLLLAVDDPDADPRNAVKSRLSIDALCTNRDLPRGLFAGGGGVALNLEHGSAAVGTIAPMTPVTSMLLPKSRDKRFWNLISHLSLGHLSVVGGAAGAATLREVLQLYDLRDTTETRAAIAGLAGVSAKPGTARLPNARPGHFCRGLDVRLEFDARTWVPSGLFLLGSVLERFLALHGTVNSFVRSTAWLQGRPDPVARWPARAGTRVLL